ncbi:MAG: LysR family transcriptional regulator [Alphaproteobacteria bacterium CG_4_10_14_0_2_um_filter_63_37]|nr:MAG: LysR family transcriptional regulator [Alphaproteobacteria bacterium CG_4_10_14_0_2_um_filter_63_37]
MNGSNREINWEAIRIFLAVAEAGSLTAAAQTLGISQPTLSRQISALEENLGAALFERVGRGIQPTAAGLALLEPARAMRTAAQHLGLAAQGQSQTLAGTVRLTASEMTATYLLPPILAALRRDHPEIELELAVSNRIENLLERSADIAIRHAPPGQGSLIARKVGNLPLGAFAHRDYLARMGPVHPADFDRHTWIGYDTVDLLIRGFQQAGLKVDRSFFGLRCDDQAVGWEMARAGMGIAFTTRAVAALDSNMERVLKGWKIPPLPVWIAAHRELKQSARIRVVFDAVVEGMGCVCGGELDL